MEDTGGIKSQPNAILVTGGCNSSINRCPANVQNGSSFTTASGQPLSVINLDKAIQSTFNTIIDTVIGATRANVDIWSCTLIGSTSFDAQNVRIRTSAGSSFNATGIGSTTILPFDTSWCAVATPSCVSLNKNPSNCPASGDCTVTFTGTYSETPGTDTVTYACGNGDTGSTNVDGLSAAGGGVTCTYLSSEAGPWNFSADAASVAGANECSPLEVARAAAPATTCTSLIGNPNSHPAAGGTSTVTLAYSDNSLDTQTIVVNCGYASQTVDVVISGDTGTSTDSCDYIGAPSGNYFLNPTSGPSCPISSIVVGGGGGGGPVLKDVYINAFIMDAGVPVNGTVNATVTGIGCALASPGVINNGLLEAIIEDCSLTPGDNYEIQVTINANSKSEIVNVSFTA